ncbi:MAG: hypothetical protein R3B48_23185 [Kofleriaceae bacterium]
MSERDDDLRGEDAALLAALCDEREPLTAPERERAEARAGSAEARDQLAAHRRLVTELRGLSSRAPSPDWSALERSILRACDEARPKAARWWSWRSLGWPLGLAGLALAALALALWPRARAPHEAARAAIAPAERPEAPRPPPGLEAPADEPAIYLDDEVLASDEIDEARLRDLVQQVPSAEAITLGFSVDDDGDEDALLPAIDLDAELERLDPDALRELERWLDAADRKG